MTAARGARARTGTGRRRSALGGYGASHLFSDYAELAHRKLGGSPDLTFSVSVGGRRVEKRYISPYYFPATAVAGAASVTKTITCWMVGEHVRDGRLALNTFVGTIIDTPIEATIEDLLCHRRGVIRDVYLPRFVDGLGNPPSRDEYLEFIAANPRSPGFWSYNDDGVLTESVPALVYSNVGFAELGRVLEHLGGKTYEELFQDFAALQGWPADQTYFYRRGLPLDVGQIIGTARNAQNTGEPEGFSAVAPLDLGAFDPAWGARLSARQMCDFGRLLLVKRNGKPPDFPLTENARLIWPHLEA